MYTREEAGVLSFALGGALFLIALYYILENANKPYIDVGLFAVSFVFPLGFVAFLLLALGLLSITKPSRNP